MKFCLNCGHPMREGLIEGRMRFRCMTCGWVFYEQLKVSSAAIIEANKKLLLLLRAQSPWKNHWYLPAGYVDADEDPRDAVRREVREETGFEVEVLDLKNCIYFSDDPRGNGILLIYRCRIIEGVEKICGEEIFDLQFFDPGNLPGNLCGAGHKQAIQEWAIIK